MKCPCCGHWNKASFPRCFQCGEALPGVQAAGTPKWLEQFERPRKKSRHALYDDATPPVVDLTDEEPEVAAPSMAEPLAAEMSKLKDRRARGTVYLEEFRKRASEQGIAPSGSGVTFQRQRGFFSDLPDDPEETVYQPPEMRAKLRSGRRRNMTRGELADDDFTPLPGDADGPLYEDDIPLSFDETLPLPPMQRSRRSRRGPRRRDPVRSAVWLVSVLAVIAVGFIAWQGILYLQTDTSRASTMLDDAVVSIEPTSIDGHPGHIIKISGQEGDKIYIAELMRSFVVVDGFATVQVADYEFYQHIEPLEMDAMEARMTPIVGDGAVERRLKPITFMIDIPLSPIRLISPEANYIVVNSSLYNMSFQVMPGSTVIVNGQRETDTVNEMGEAQSSVNIQPIGENIVKITVRAPYHRENNMTVTFYREPQEIPLQLAADTQVRTDTQEMTIHATTAIGATVTIESPTYSLDTTNLDKTGQFSFRARMVRVGTNEIKIRASMPGKADSLLIHTVTYLPKASEYTTTAWALSAQDYTELLNNIQDRVEKAQKYLCRGVIVEILSNKPQIAIMDTGTDGKEQLVMLQNSARGDTMKDIVWEVGETYRVFADVSGLYGTIPRLIGRYSYYVPPATPKPE